VRTWKVVVVGGDGRGMPRDIYKYSLN